MRKVHNSSSKIFLISGASSGIGRVIAVYLAAKGNIVYAGARKDTDIKQLNQYNNITGIQLDVTNQENIVSALNLIEEKHGCLDVLINNAGNTGWGSIIDLDLDDFKNIMEVNVWGMISLIQASYPLLRKSTQFPIIFNISSQGAKYVFPFWAPYHISKYGVKAMSDALRRELLPYHIRVCELQLGPFKSKAFDTLEQLLEEYKLKYVNSEFTPRLSRMFEKFFLNSKRNEKSPHVIAKLIEKISNQKKYRVRYQLGRKWLVSLLLTKFPQKWVDYVFLKKFP